MLKKILTISGLVLLLGLLGAYFYFSSLWVGQQKEYCSSLQICLADSTSNPLLKSAEVKRYLDLQQIHLLGQACDSISTHNLELLLKDFATVKNCNAYTSIDGVLHIVIDQHDPVLRLECANSTSFFMCKDGWLLPAINRERLNLPLLTGNFPFSYSEFYRGKIKQEDVWMQKMKSLVEEISASEFWSSVLGQIHVLSQENILLLTNWKGPRLHIGNLEHPSTKLHKLLRFYESVAPVKGMNYYTDVDAGFERQIVCIPNKENLKKKL